MSTATHVTTVGNAEPLIHLDQIGSEQEWLDIRRDGIGGSDAAACIGASDYRGPYAVWLSKVYDLDVKLGDEFDHPTQWGHRLEDVVAQAYGEKNGRRVMTVGSILRSPTKPFMIGNLDRAVAAPGEEPFPLEVKTTSSRWWDGDLPPSWEAQVRHYLSVTGMDHADVAVLVAGNRYEQHRVHRDDDIETLVAAETAVWDAVVNRVPPPFDYSRDSHALLASAEADGRVELDDEALDLLRQYQHAKSLEKDATALAKRLRGELEAVIGTAAYVYVDNVQVATWKSHTRNQIDHDALRALHPTVAEEVTLQRPYRQLRVHKKGLDIVGHNTAAVHDPADTLEETA